MLPGRCRGRSGAHNGCKAWRFNFTHLSPKRQKTLRTPRNLESPKKKSNPQETLKTLRFETQKHISKNPPKKPRTQRTNQSPQPYTLNQNLKTLGLHSTSSVVEIRECGCDRGVQRKQLLLTCLARVAGFFLRGGLRVQVGCGV